MLNRRLLVLFFALFAVFCALTFRLIKLQLVESQAWREVVRAFVHRTHLVETYRGPILDRNGVILAQDVPSDELAIDYRAMNLDDAWLTRTAIDRLKDSGKWGTFPDRAARNQRINQIKDDLAAKIEATPAAIARICQIPREDVLDRFGEIRYRIHVLRQDQWSRRHALPSEEARANGAATADGMDIDDAALDASFRETQIKEEFNAHTVRSNIPAAVANYFRQHSEDYPGLVVRDKANRRDYPFGEATAHIVGTLRFVDAPTRDSARFAFPDLLNVSINMLPDAQVAGLRGYLPGDRMGETGAEKLLEPLVRGARGAKLVDLNDSGDESTKESRHIDPEPGQSVRLTIDAPLQKDIYAALQDPVRGLLHGEDGENHFVAMVVMSLDGQILALISYPSYDPNTIDELRVKLNQDGYRTPLVNRATSGTYHPGSTIKPILASAGLTEGLITPDETILCTGHYFPNRTDIFRCPEAPGPEQLVSAIAKSCNVYFYTVGNRMGVPRLAKWYGLYGFGRDTGMELPEARGNIPNANETEPDQARNDSLLLGIGQGGIDVTPLQMASAYGTLLRRGLMIQPRILVDTPIKQSQVFQLSPAVLAPIREGMEHVVSVGTAKTAFRNFRLPVAGKTGTAEKYRGIFDDDGNPMDDPARPMLTPDGSPRLKPDGTPMFRQKTDLGTDAWFVGYAPADNPRFIIAAVMEWGGRGGAKAAPMVREAFLQLQKHNYLPHMDVP